MGDYLLIKEITPGMATWTSKVVVIEKLNIRESAKNPGKIYKPFVLQDSVGNKVKALAYGHEISVIDQRLSLHNTYLISNAMVSNVYANFNVPDVEYQFIWSINRRTLIQDVDAVDKLEIVAQSEAAVTPFNAFYDSMIQKELINVLGLIICKLPREFVLTSDGPKKANDFVIIDDQSQPIIVTMWNEFASIQGHEIQGLLDAGIHPIILAKHLAVTSYQSKSDFVYVYKLYKKILLE
ncbi:unnamed protein product [Cuscuta epithymum]|uniref:Replication protein A OB domain-containing protein n=2 Tax=Cuscuta epithymum TaxID=186058 RepID=A0AAV0DKQ5_9ASTE|nr:unnamed protein product [Cuscuta epithymum]